MALLCCTASCVVGGPAAASELVISRDAVQALVLKSIFKDQGRWYLARGKCFSYFDQPRIALADGRVAIEAHLSSRLGLEVGGSCAGTDFASDVQLSGRFAGAGSHIMINDIRIDNVKDESTRQALQLVETALGSSLPKAVNIDLLPLLTPTTVPGTAIRVMVTKLAIGEVRTQSDSIAVDFEMKLNAQ